MNKYHLVDKEHSKLFSYAHMAYSGLEY